MLTRREALARAAAHLRGFRLTWELWAQRWERSAGKNFATEFTEWIANAPEGVEIRLDSCWEETNEG